MSELASGACHPALTLKKSRKIYFQKYTISFRNTIRSYTKFPTFQFFHGFLFPTIIEPKWSFALVKLNLND